MNTNSYKEIGGYLSLDFREGDFLHSDGLLLNSASSALKLIIRNFKIKKIAAPFHTCMSVWDVLQDEGCEIVPYDLDHDFLPLCDASLPIIYTNYFGLLDNNAEYVCQRHEFAIIDNAQSFYSPPEGNACFYSPRKFFGVPDGGILYPHLDSGENIKKSISWNRVEHLLRRIDEGAEAAYESFRKSEDYLQNAPVELMSNLSRSMLGNLDYEHIAKKRRENYQFLHERLGALNDLKLPFNNSAVPLAYPFSTKKSALREKLQKSRIFVPTYWPYSDISKQSPDAMRLAHDILPLPIDQRYGFADMQRIVDVINEHY